MSYKPISIVGYETGLVQNRENFLLPNDAYPQLVNAYVWREQRKRKQGYELLGRLRRKFETYGAGVTAASFNIFTAINLSGAINNIVLGNPTQVTTGAAHGLESGQWVTITNVGGTVELNDHGYQITVTGANTFTMNVDSTTYTAYTAATGNWETGNTGNSTTEPNKTIECGSVEIYVTPVIVTGNITGYTNDINCIVTSVGHGLSTGDMIDIENVVVVPNSGDNIINGGPYTITVIDVDTFQLNQNSTEWGIYQSGGNWAHTTAANTLSDNGDGTLTGSGGGLGTINYISGGVTLSGIGVGLAMSVSFNYFPGLPVMGLRTRELTSTNFEQMVAFDTRYAYTFQGDGFQEFLYGTVWSGNDSDFFWTTNYWVSDGDIKVFWETTFNTDPIRYCNGQIYTNWYNFQPIINAANDRLETCRCMIPFRGRLVVFNTVENAIAYPQRIRWAAIGNPFSETSAIISTINANAWRDDIRGQGGFLDIPTTEDIISVGFVRDNVVVYCERSTWQLRYTGRSIAPFQIEKVNPELGVESTFSSIQMDTSLIGIGDKGVVDCDSFKSTRIDIKIPDLVQSGIKNTLNGYKRIQGIRDFEKRLLYWIYPSVINAFAYPDSRLVYNYENDSWAIFTDSFTALGYYQDANSKRWIDYPETSWVECQFPWINLPSQFASPMAGNQQGYVIYLDQLTTNDVGLFITAITGRQSTNQPTVITSPNHNLKTGQIIQIVNIDAGSFTNLDNQIFSVTIIDQNTFELYKYNANDDQFSTPQIDPAGTYIGCGEIKIRDNFSMVSKQFNNMDLGQQIQIGYIDVLVETTEQGAFTVNIYTNYSPYNSNYAINKPPLNVTNDTFFNQTIETYQTQFQTVSGTKSWKRFYCPTNSNFITIQYTLSNSQMNGIEQESIVQIDSETIWTRPGGRLGITF